MYTLLRSIRPVVNVTIFMVLIGAVDNDKIDENRGPGRPVQYLGTYMLL